MDFNPGDKVILKSGGPEMTVERIGKLSNSEDMGVTCIWFERNGNKQELKRETFIPETLEYSEDQEPTTFTIGGY